MGRQLSNLTVGVLGNGRLGKIYSDAMRHLSNELLIHDPFIDQTLIPKMSALSQIANCNIISIHVHLANTKNLIDPDFLSRCKPDVLIVNTRGGIVDENAMTNFLSENLKQSMLRTF